MAKKLNIDIDELNKELAERQIECLSPEYLGSQKKHEWLCLKCQNRWFIPYNDIVNSSRGCPKCGYKRVSESLSLKIDIKELNKKIKKRNIKCLSKKYTKTSDKYEWQCLVCNTVWFATYNHIINGGHSCPQCAIKRRYLKIDIKKLNRKLEKRNIKCLSLKYLGSDKKHKFKCLKCNNVWYSRYSNVINDNQGCSKCKYINMMGKNNPHWRGGKKTGYPPEFNESKKESIRNRDNRKCQYSECNYDDTKEKRKLCVHHIDGNKQNCEDWNLISLCHKHHMKIENDNPKLWEDYFYEYTNSFEL